MAQSSTRRLVTEAALSINQAAQDSVITNQGSRLAAVETLGGLAPGDVSDATVRSIVANQASTTAVDLAGRFAKKVDIFAYVNPAQDLQAAITAAAGTGKVLLVTAGTYAATTLNISGNVELWCEPGTVLKQANASNRDFLDLATVGSRFVMRGGTIDQNNANQGARLGKFAFRSSAASATVEFHGVTFKDFCEGAIRFVGDRDTSTRETLRVINCKFRGGTESEENLYDTFTIYGADGAEVVVEGCDFDLGFVTSKQGVPAITIQSTSTASPAYTKLTARNNVFRGYGRTTSNSPLGVIDFYAWGESLDIEGNKFYDARNAPIRGKTNTRNTLIRGNHLLSFLGDATTGGGINVVRATLMPVIGNLEISSNIITGAPARGIEVSNDPDAVGPVRIHDNQVSGCGGTSIYLMGLANFNVHNNTLTNGAGTGITYVQCSGNGSISKNIIAGMAAQGIINNSDQLSLDLQVHDNMVSGATTCGITAENLRYLSLQGNTVKDTTDGGAEGQRGYRVGGTNAIQVAHIKNNTATGTFVSGAFTPMGAGIITRYEEGNTWNHRVNHGTAAPVAGTYSRGDIVWNTTPSPSGTVGWICTTAGTPGTWKTFGAIGA